jgi:hypothetical protein
MKNWKTILLAGAAVAICGVAFADGPKLPLHKPGLWQQTIQQDGKQLPDASSQICFDTPSESKLSAENIAAADKNCQSQHMTHDASSWIIDAVCTRGPGWTTRSHTLVTGDFGSKVTMAIDSTTTGAPASSLNGEHKIVMTVTREGPCKPGQKGGDVTMSDGRTLNLLNPPASPQQ